MGWIENQLAIVTNRVEYLFRLLQDLTGQLRAVQQGLQSAFQQTQGPSSSGGATCWYAAGLSLAGTSGGFPSITCASTTTTVYQLSAGGLVSIGTQTVYNAMPDACDNTKRQVLGKNADGTFSVIGQSCS
jgi:hypothetical protein